jgi:L-malate glycosyltransferase
MRNKVKVIHIIQSLESGGCENFLLRLLPNIDNFDNVVLTVKNRGVLANKFEDRGIKVDCLHNNWFGIFNYLNKHKPDKIITYLFHGDILGRFFIRLFTKYHPIPFLRTTYNYPKYWIARVFEKYSSFLVDKYLANSESVKNFYVNNLGVDRKKITVIPNGIDLNTFESAKRYRNIFRKQMKVLSDEKVIVCVANLHKNKGHIYLLKAFEKIYKKNKNIWLWLVGDGKERNYIEKEMNKYKFNNKIVLFGKRDDVPIILSASDIFVLPTLFEGMSNAIMEAMASGLPIVTTDIKENGELLKEYKNKILVDVNEIESGIMKIFDKEKMIDREVASLDIQNSIDRLTLFVNS